MGFGIRVTVKGSFRGFLFRLRLMFPCRVFIQAALVAFFGGFTFGGLSRHCKDSMVSSKALLGGFRKLGVPYFGVLL